MLRLRTDQTLPLCLTVDQKLMRFREYFVPLGRLRRMTVRLPVSLLRYLLRLLQQKLVVAVGWVVLVLSRHAGC